MWFSENVILEEQLVIFEEQNAILSETAAKTIRLYFHSNNLILKKFGKKNRLLIKQGYLFSES